MTQLIPIDLSLRLQALRIPVDWTMDASVADPESGAMFTPVIQEGQKATVYDPWGMRREFFQLEEGDHEGLLEFLNRIGLFRKVDAGSIAISNAIESEIRRRGGKPEIGRWDNLKSYWFDAEGGSYEVLDPEPIFARSVDLWRLVSKREMLHPTERGFSESNFEIRFPIKGASGLITTTDFMAASSLSIRSDQLQGARTRKCKRPDCGALFSSIGPRKRKYCSWYCGHIESVRRERRRERKAHGK